MKLQMVYSACVFSLVAFLSGSPKLLSDDQCASIFAQSSSKCCDPDGADTKCPAVTGSCVTTKVPQIPGVTRYGVWCDPEGAFCAHAPQGPNDAECESSWRSVTCSYNADKTECNFIYNAVCKSDKSMKDGDEYWTCVCKDGVTTSKASKTRLECNGDACWW